MSFQGVKTMNNTIQGEAKMKLKYRVSAVLVLFASMALAAPKPPTAEDPLIAITPVTRSMDRIGGDAAINTSGSGIWRASVSDNWILLKGTSGEAGFPVPYVVSANNGVEARIGYVYVSGHVHTIIQPGLGASLSAYSSDFEREGGSGSVRVTAEAGNTWHAKSNVDWITVASSSGTGSQNVSFTVAAYDEVSTRSGTLTIADNTYTVNQTGRRMMLKTTNSTSDYLSDTIKIRINALASTEWSVSKSAEWITVVDSGSGKGGGVVTISLAQNPSSNERNATVTIGTETFSVRQLGTTALVFKIDTTEAEFGKEGASGERVLVTATPDLNWQAVSSADWIELYAGYTSGSGIGNVMYKVKPNPTLYPRSGEITFTAAKSGVAVKRLVITEAAAVATLTAESYEFAAAGESFTVGVNTGDIVGWAVINPVSSWITVSGQPSSGSAAITLTAAPNTTVQPRSGIVRIADHDFAVSQKGRGVEVSYKDTIFGTDGKTRSDSGDNVIQVKTENDVSWTAVASDPTWIVIYEGKSGTGNGTVKYIVAPYVGDGELRTGMITIGDQVVYVTQRPYELSIDPNGERAVGNAGAGEFQVALDIDGVWNAIATEPWITIVTGYDSGTGSGKVIYHYTDNNTGKERTGKIMINGSVYTLTQAARQLVEVKVAGEGEGGTLRGGEVEGAGQYTVGDVVTLRAVPHDGYRFSHWVLPNESQSTVVEQVFTVAAATTYRAVFVPLKPSLSVKDACLKGVTLHWSNLAWAAKYIVFRGTSSDRGLASKIVERTNDGICECLDATGSENTSYWYWIEAVGVEDDVWSDAVQGRRAKKDFTITYTNLRGTTHANPSTYREGSAVTFSAPSPRRGYTFVGWTPSSIQADASGDQTVRAVWLQNEYKVRFDLNGAQGEMADESFTYGFWKYLSETNFSRAGYAFLGWTDEKGTPAKYQDKESVKNLTEQLNAAVTLYAVWQSLIGVEVVDDSGAVVEGDETIGFTVKPSSDKKQVIISIPDGFDPAKVTIVVGTEVETVAANGAKIRIVKGAHDITAYLDLPDPVGGTTDLTKATVKEEIAKEPLDVKKGAEIKLDASSPSITTSVTREGLTYTLREGTTLQTMATGDSKIGDGKAWTPKITVKGGQSGFYTIEVTK